MEVVLIGLATVFAVAFLLGEFAAYFRLPRAVGQLTAGVILGVPLFSGLLGAAGPALSSLAELGIIFLLLLAGMSVDPQRLRAVGRDVVVVALFSVFTPFLLGLAATVALGYGWAAALIVGAALSITAEGTTVEVLRELRLLSRKVGVVILGAGILDDVFELIFLSGLVVLLQHPSLAAFFEIPLRIGVFLLVSAAMYYLYPVLSRCIPKKHSELVSLSWAVLFTLITAALSEVFGTGYVIGAFVAGMIIRARRRSGERLSRVVHDLELFTFAVIVPFFFVSVGLQLSLPDLLLHWPVVAFLLLVAVVGKVGGALLTYPFTDLSWRQLFFVGWGMNSRGAVELIAAELALGAGLLSIELFSAIVAVSVLTTMLFPLLASRLGAWTLAER